MIVIVTIILIITARVIIITSKCPRGRSGVWGGHIFISIRMARESLKWTGTAPFNRSPQFPNGGRSGVSDNLFGSSWAFLGTLLGACWNCLYGVLGFLANFLKMIIASDVRMRSPLMRKAIAPRLKMFPDIVAVNKLESSHCSPNASKRRCQLIPLEL